MVIHPWEINTDLGKARLGLGLVCEALGFKCNLMTCSVWFVKADDADRDTILELAKEKSNEAQ